MTTPTLARTERSAPTLFLPFAVSVTLCAAGIWLGAAGDDALEVEDAVDGAMLMLFPLVGGLLVRRGDHTRIGVLCSVVGVVAGLGYLVGGYSTHDWPGRSLAAVLGTGAFVVSICLLMNFLPLLFPDGHLPSRRWRPVAWAGALGAVLAVGAGLVMPGDVDEDASELGTNPLGISALEPALEIAELAGLLLFAATAVLAVASLVVRWRRSTGPARRQVAILAAGFAVLIGLFLLDSTLQSIGGAVYGVIAAVIALGAVPAAIGLSLLRD